MEQIILNITSKPNDYILCKCKKINWYENIYCINCGKKLSKKTMNEKQAIKYYNEEIKYYKLDGYTQSEVDDILTDV